MGGRGFQNEIRLLVHGFIEGFVHGSFCKAPWPFVELHFSGLPLVSKPHLLTAVLQGKQGHHNGLWGGQSSRLSLSPLHLQPHEDQKLNLDK